MSTEQSDIEWENNFLGLRHGATLKTFFELFFKDDIVAEDRQEFLEFLKVRLSITIPELDAQIQTGLENGYTPEDQLLIIQKVMAKEVSLMKRQ